MELKDWLGPAISGVAALTSGIFALLAYSSANKSRGIAMGQAETSLRGAISTTRQRFRDVVLKVVEVRAGRRDDDLNAADKRQLATLDAALREAVEDHLNAYEDACAKYNDGKIDKVRFRRMYEEEIRGLCRNENQAIRSLLHPSDTSKFNVIWSVYREWHHNEGR